VLRFLLSVPPARDLSLPELAGDLPSLAKKKVDSL
jgi:hypothetical protein